VRFFFLLLTLIIHHCIIFSLCNKQTNIVIIVTKLMWEAIETPRPSAWRVIFKGLTLLEHLLKNGSERCVDDARNHSHILRNLDKFNYYEGTVDRGVGVREKSKQVVEVLQDDERIREERQKARALREKFSGRGAVSSSSGGGGGSGGGAVKYEGYGNSDAKWAQSSGAGGSTGYGDSGIGATTSRNADSNKAYAGRYGEGDTIAATTRRSSSKSSTTTGGGAAKVKKPKKKEKAVVPEAAVPELDLFSFDVAPTTTSAPIADHTFDAFGSSSPAATATMVSLPPPSQHQQQMRPSVAVTTHDDFGDFATASSAVQFDAFGSTAPPATSTMAQPTFDAFGSSPPPMATMNNAFGNMSMSSSSGPTTMMNTTNSTPVNTAVGGNDDFGDFEDADPFSNKTSQTSSDPLSKLISLDGLTKKPKKVEGKPDNGAPIDFSKPLGGMGGAAMGDDKFEAPLVLGTGKQGDIGEVFGQLMESTPKTGMIVGQQQNNNGMGMTNSAGGMGGMGGQPMYPQMQMGMGQQGGMMFNQGNMGMMGGNMTLQQQQQQMMMMQQQMQMQGGMMQPQMGNMMGMNMMGGTQNQPQQKNNMNGNGNNMGW
jgi:epsin